MNQSLKRVANVEADHSKRQQVREEGELVQDDQSNDGEVDEAEQIKLILGISSFGSTKNTHVVDNSTTAAKGGRAPRQTRKSQQYMNLKKNQPKETSTDHDGAEMKQ